MESVRDVGSNGRRETEENYIVAYQSSVVLGVPRGTLNQACRMKTETDEFKAVCVRETVIGCKNDLVEQIIRLQRVGFVLKLMTFAEWHSSLLYKTKLIVRECQARAKKNRTSSAAQIVNS